MYATILNILIKALGKLHPLVKKMQSKIDDAAKKNKDDKVVDFPKKDLEVVAGEKAYRALSELDIERATKEQLKDFQKDLEEVIDLGPDKLSKLPIDQQGNFFRNVKRFERRLLQDPESKEGIASLKRPEAPVLKIESGEQLTGQGLESLQKKLGLPKDSPGPRKSKIDQGIIGMKRGFANIENTAAEIGAEADQVSKQGDDIFGTMRLENLRDEAELRGVARSLIIDDIKAGKLKNLSPGMKKGMLEPTGSGLDGDPIDVLFRYYGPEASEVLDMLVKKHGATPDGIDLIKLDLKNKVDIQPEFEFKPREFPIATLGGKEGKIPLTQKEVVEFFTGVDANGNPVSKEKLKFYNKHIDLADDESNVQGYLKRFLQDQNDQGQFLKNLPSNFSTKGAVEMKGTKFSAEEIDKLKFKIGPEDDFYVVPDAQTDIDPDDLVEAPGLPNILAV
jgi:hypothetical protein